MQEPHRSAASPLMVGLPDLEREHGPTPLRVEGRLPERLIGTYVQNGPARWTGVHARHWFDGLGALRAVYLRGGDAHGAVRFIHSPSVDADMAGRSHHMAFADSGSVRERLGGLIGRRPLRNLANVNVTHWQGRLLALMETTPPVEVRLETLESCGETDLGGALSGALQAHYHRVPSRQTTYYFGQRINRNVHVDVYAFPDGARPRRLCSLRLPGVTELHDFAVTEHHAVLMLTPLWASPLKMLWRGSYVDSFRWQPERGTEIVAISLDDGAVTQRFVTEPFFFWHVVNAWQQGPEPRIQIDLIRYPDFARSVIFRDPQGLPDQPNEPSYSRGTLDVSRGEATWEKRWDGSCEFPQVHPMRHAVTSRYVWMVAHHPKVQTGWWDRLVCLDTETGHADWIVAGDRCAVGEPVVVPCGEGERDVWVLALVWDVDRGATHLAIWDGSRAGEDAVARVWFDQPLPLGLHGCWIPG